MSKWNTVEYREHQKGCIERAIAGIEKKIAGGDLSGYALEQHESYLSHLKRELKKKEDQIAKLKET